MTQLALAFALQQTSAVGAGFLLGSFLEYAIHRFMHWDKGFIGQRHKNHHRKGTGQGMLLEFRDYFMAMLVFDVLFYFTIPASICFSFCAGVFVFELFSAYAHQLQHDNPTKCDWMQQPQHYLHHKGQMWYHNFGMAVDWWDRIFGTYKVVDGWCTEKERKAANPSRWAIKWY